jgi:hypothetical protein
MSFYKTTLFIQAVAETPPNGFTESWSWEETSESSLFNHAAQLASERSKILSSSYQIVSYRIARLTGIQGGSFCTLKQSLVQTAICPVPLVGKLGVADLPAAAVLVSMAIAGLTINEVPQVHRPRQWQLRGIPDTWWDGAALVIPAADKTKITNFCNFLTSVLFAGIVFGYPLCPDLNVQKYQSCCTRRISSRRIGRPFGLLRGRRSKRPTT